MPHPPSSRVRVQHLVLKASHTSALAKLGARVEQSGIVISSLKGAIIHEVKVLGWAEILEDYGKLTREQVK